MNQIDYGDMAWRSDNEPWTVWSQAPRRIVMPDLLSPRQAAQAAVDQAHRLAVGSYDRGRWGFDTDSETAVMIPPSGLFYMAFHTPTMRFFRSVSPRSNKITPTDLGSLIDPERGWVVTLLRSGNIPRGRDILAAERGDPAALKQKTELVQAFEARLRLARVRPDEPDELTVSIAPPPTPQPLPAGPKKETVSMALLDIKKDTFETKLIEEHFKVELDRLQLIGVIRAAGATDCPRDCELKLIYGNQSIDVKDDLKLMVSWKRSRTEERSA